LEIEQQGITKPGTAEFAVKSTYDIMGLEKIRMEWNTRIIAISLISATIVNLFLTFLAKRNND
jgi:hypothetical protein